MSRISGSRKVVNYPEQPIFRLEVWDESLSDAVTAVNYRQKSQGYRANSEKGNYLEAARNELRYPDKEAIARADDQAGGMIEAAQALDPRLVRKPSWVRGLDGETACPALLMAGEESAFFARRRTETAQAVGGDPVLVTVSTDSSEVSPESLAAFIATVKLVQQFRPVHVVWQGAWLVSSNVGYVFHVPLVTGDMDFERLAFVINSKLRDAVSFSFMMRRAVEVTRQGWGMNASNPAEWSYLPGSVDFVNHAGIAADPESIAARACKWLGWEAPWLNRYNDRATAISALCRWEDGEESMRPEYKPVEYSKEQLAKWDAEAKERARRTAEKEKEDQAKRLAAVL